jgi:hypothetical protein
MVPLPRGIIAGPTRPPFLGEMLHEALHGLPYQPVLAARVRD